MASPSSAALSPQHTAQYLSSLLSQTGPNALSYNEDVKFLIRQHLMNLMQVLPTLQTRPARFVHDNGTFANILQVEGTIPMTFHGTSYNTPVVIWLLETYPRFPPRVFVSPTKDMIIKRFHKHVDASGWVSLPYLQSWMYPRSNLVDLARSLSFVFSQDPPVYANPASSSSRPQKPPRSSVASAGSGTVTNHTSIPSTSPSTSQMQPPVASRHRADSAASRPSSRAHCSWRKAPENARSERKSDSSEVLRRNAVKTLVERLELDKSALRKECEKDLDARFKVQSRLKQRGSKLGRAVRDMQQEEESLRQKLSVLNTNNDLMEGWLTGQGDSSLDIDVDVDDAFEPCDASSKQLLESMSIDFALEDVLYSLDKAIQRGAVSADVYLKQVRHVAREQFFYRAAVTKMEAAHQQHT